MADLETVVKALECCTTTDEQGFPRCEECPYADSDGTCPDIDAMHRHALELLKEHEPVEAQTMGESKSHGSWWFACGACGHAIDPEDNYCRECGRKVKWDADT